MLQGDCRHLNYKDSNGILTGLMKDFTLDQIKVAATFLNDI